MKEREAVVKWIAAFFTPKIPYFTPLHHESIAKIRYNKRMGMYIKKRGRDKSIIIFVTGYREYMEDAFDVNAFHYLVKPVDEKKFHTVFNRALKEVSAKTKKIFCDHQIQWDAEKGLAERYLLY